MKISQKTSIVAAAILAILVTSSVHADTVGNAGFYTIGYTGAPERPPLEVDGVFQPLIWQDNRLAPGGELKGGEITLSTRTPASKQELSERIVLRR